MTFAPALNHFEANDMNVHTFFRGHLSHHVLKLRERSRDERKRAVSSERHVGVPLRFELYILRTCLHVAAARNRHMTDAKKAPNSSLYRHTMKRFVTGYARCTHDIASKEGGHIERREESKRYIKTYQFWPSTIHQSHARANAYRRLSYSECTGIFVALTHRMAVCSSMIKSVSSALGGVVPSVLRTL